MQLDNQYDELMTEKYLSKIINGSLIIDNDSELTSLQFVQYLNVNQFKLLFCKTVIPELSSSTINEMDITYCNAQSLEHYRLENLEILNLQCYKIDGMQQTQILWNIVQFPKLQQLSLFGFIGVDITPLSQIAFSITKLSLNTCGLKNVEILKILLNLKELDLSNNQFIDISALHDMTQLISLDLSFCCLENVNTLRSLIILKELKLRCNLIDVTPLQYLTNLFRIDLNSCGLYNISVLQYLDNLEEVDISNNCIIYIQPLQQLNSIVELDARFNKIIDVHTIQYHRNYDKYRLDFQEQLTSEEMYFIKLQQYQEKQFNQEIQQIYQKKVVNYKLKINNNPQLTNLNFIQNLSIRILELENCENIVSKFKSNQITELFIQQCNISNFKQIDINNLEILTLNSQIPIYAPQLTQTIVKFQHMQELNINGYHHIDLKALQQMHQLTRLSLASCDLQDIACLKLYTNLKYLDLSNNENINDFTYLKYFTQLNILHLKSCGLNSIDLLKNLVNLNELNIQNNYIMYIQPIEDLNYLQHLNAKFNKIIDIYTIEYHPNFKKFDVGQQKQHTKEILSVINKQRDLYVSKWEISNTKQYQNQIIDKSLHIEYDQELLCLQFMRNFNITQLVLNNCKNLTPILKNKTITQLQISNCNIKSIKQLWLENLEVLQLDSEVSKYYSYLSKEYNSIMFNDLTYELLQFEKLKQLRVIGYMWDDYRPFSQMSQLNILQLRYCSVQRIDSFIYLINLRELSLEGNKNIDITPIQYLTQLMILNLNNCDIRNIDAINSLVNLEQLQLESNKIVYIQSLQSLNKLLNLNVFDNQIKDIQSIKKHINFNKFMLGNQSTPEHLEEVFANKMRDIQAPIYSLKKIKAQRIKILGQKQKFVDEISNRFLALLQSQISFSINVASIFEQLNSFETYQ
ncbi:Conserved_hypothetical protein [Hexamita inflata]|uniref:Uncharacterized protein n=1 Tax=Hexamita inflata TaxID=28002 RepID=A0AA86UJ36_9EUKA|nr:Conserved hypothetical protein [Hexamita inflata]